MSQSNCSDTCGHIARQALVVGYYGVTAAVQPVWGGGSGVHAVVIRVGAGNAVAEWVGKEEGL